MSVSGLLLNMGKAEQYQKYLQDLQDADPEIIIKFPLNLVCLNNIVQFKINSFRFLLLLKAVGIILKLRMQYMPFSV